MSFEVFCEKWDCRQVGYRNIEVLQDSGFVGVDGYYSGNAAFFENRDYGFHAEDFAREEASVLAGIGKIWYHRGDSASFKVSGVVGHKDELEKPLILRRAGRLNDDCVLVL